MDVFESLADLGARYPRIHVALGNFDGVHRGHQHLIQDMLQSARDDQGTSVVATFYPHPLQVVRPEKSPRLLTGKNHKIRLMEALGVDVLLLLPFTPKLAQMSPEEFASTILSGKLKARKVFVGFNYTFGYQGEGTPEHLQVLGQEYGFDVGILEPIQVNGLTVSSSRVRRSLEAGHIAQARELLGYWPQLAGEVVQGEQRGRTLGFPTANLRMEEGLLIPSRGVYTAVAEGSFGFRRAVVNIGVKPTFHADWEPTIEAHLLDFEGDLYGQGITLHMVEKIRGERSFASVNALVEQIGKDVEEAWQTLSNDIFQCVLQTVEHPFWGGC